MFKKILIPNRGEIALRIIRTCREMGIPSVLACSTADSSSLPARLADEKVCIGPPQARESYLNIPAIMSAVEVTKADAVHPGYGFLSEEGNFAEVCESSGIKFIGPSSEVIKLLGNKLKAREIAMKAGVPVVPGSDSFHDNNDELAQFAESIGYPVLIKAVSGGGGRGMKIVNDSEELRQVINIARSEATAAFGDGRVYIEKYFPDARHVEVQILADEYGNLLSLWERECSIQRRFQKLIEETPSPAVNPDIRRKLTEAGIAIAKNAGYTNAGTLEFLLLENGDFYFLEMNTRIQVEHPVTECITGIDIVREQILIAQGEKLKIKQHQIKMNGSSIEARINAEDPVKWMPSPGTISTFILPGGPGIRVDSAMYSGSEVTPFYDSLIAKLISHGEDREMAIKRLLRALRECIIEGVQTNIPLHLRIFADPDFVAGRFNTRFIERFAPALK